MVQTRSGRDSLGSEGEVHASSDKGNVFHKGVAISMWQNSGDEDSNWTNFIKSNFPFKALPFGFHRYSGKYNVMETCPDTWNRYNDMLDAMEAAGLEPNATLHHFTHPQWFDDLGGFEREENIDIFVQWAIKAVELFGSRILYWATFNEPTCAMFLGWITGMHPPGKILSVFTAGKVLLHKLQAHCRAYEAIKRTPIGKTLQVGLVHHHITFLATGPRILRGLAEYAASWMTYWWGYELIHTWMLTGKFTWKVPVLGQTMEWQYPGGRPPCDWFGVNYYSRAVVTWYLKPWCLPGEVMTDMYYPIYAEGLYDALMQTLRAIADGADVRGFYYWTLVDNFEWNAGYLMEFGLYAWRPDGSVDRQLKEGARTLVRYFKSLPSLMADVKAVAAQMSSAGDLPSSERIHAEAQAAKEGLTALGHRHSTRKKHAMMAAT
eukprot:gene5032-5274_t